MPEIAGQVADGFADAVREHEEQWLSPLAVRSYETRGREAPEEECRLRTPFQRDRDRDRPLEGLPSAAPQDAGVRRSRGRPLPHPAHAHVGGRRDRARRRAGAAPERGPHRGDRGRPRRRSPAVRPRGRAGTRRAAARARSRRLSPQRALAARRRAARARRPRAQPDVGGARRHPQAHRPGGARDARGPDRPARRPLRLHQPRHRRRRPGRVILDPADLPAEPIALLGDTGSRRIDTLVHDVVENSARAGDIVQSDEIGEAMLALRSLHVRARLPRAGSRPAPGWRCSGSSTTWSTSAGWTTRPRPTTSPG